MRNNAAKVSLFLILAIILVNLPFLLLPSILASDNSTTKQDDPKKDEDVIVLRIRNFPDRRAIDVHSKAQLALIDEFSRRHPNIKLVRATGLQVYGEISESSDYMAIAGGTAPDVFELFLRKVPNFLEQEFLIPLDTLPYFDEEWLKTLDVPPQLWPVVYRNGHYYGIIYTYYTMGLIYRRDLLREAGLPDRPPQTWDELYYYAQKLTDPEKKIKRALIQTGQWGFDLPSSYFAGWFFTSFVWQAGGDMVHQYATCPKCGEYIELPKEEDLSRCPKCGAKIPPSAIKWKAVFDSPQGIMALNFWKALRWNVWTRCPECGEPVDLKYFDWKSDDPKWVINEHPVCPKCGKPLFPELEPLTEEKIQALVREKKAIVGVARYTTDFGIRNQQFFNGELAMMIGVPSQQFLEDAKRSGIRPDQVGFASMPAGPTGVRANFIGGGVYGINSTQHDPRIIKAAWDYIKFMSSQEAERIRTDVFVREGYANLLEPRLLKKYGYMEYYKLIPPEIISAYQEIRKYGRVEPTCPNYQNVQTTELAVPLDTVLTDPNADAAEVLHKCAQRVNSVIFGERPEEEMRLYRKIAYALLIGSGVLIVFLLTRIFKGLASEYRLQQVYTRVPLKRQFVAWLLMMPALLTVLTWQYVPLVRGSLMAFFDYRLLKGFTKDTFVGIDNFIDVVLNPLTWQVALQTLYYVGLTLGLGFVAPIILAILLSEVPRGKMLFRTIFYLPAVTTGLVIMFLWKKLLYDPSPEGLLNKIVGAFVTGLAHFGSFLHIKPLANLYFQPINWLGNPKTAMLCIVLPGVWAGVGPGSIIYLAAMKCVPEQLYEAADIDGASTWQKIAHVTLPTIKPLIIINFVGAFIGSFRAMQNVFVMTAGGPANKTRVIGIEIFYNAFLYLKFGYATALAWILGVVLIGFTMYQLRILRQVEFRAAGGVET